MNEAELHALNEALRRRVERLATQLALKEEERIRWRVKATARARRIRKLEARCEQAEQRVERLAQDVGAYRRLLATAREKSAKVAA